jgi:hypothetical protein
LAGSFRIASEGLHDQHRFHDVVPTHNLLDNLIEHLVDPNNSVAIVAFWGQELTNGFRFVAGTISFSGFEKCVLSGSNRGTADKSRTDADSNPPLNNNSQDRKA